MKKEYQDRIDDFLLDRMSDEERKSFESDVAEDAELKEQLQFTETVQQATKSRNEKLAKMEEWQDDYEWNQSRLSERRFFYWVSGIAAVLVVGLFMFNYLHVGERGFDYNSVVVRGTSKGGGGYSSIMKSFSQNNFKKALDLINEELSILKKDSVKLMKDSDLEDKVKEYDLLVLRSRRDDLIWLKVHALLGLHRQNDALLLLDELRNTEGAYQMSADSLYNRLKR